MLGALSVTTAATLFIIPHSLQMSLILVAMLTAEWDTENCSQLNKTKVNLRRFGRLQNVL